MLCVLVKNLFLTKQAKKDRFFSFSAADLDLRFFSAARYFFAFLALFLAAAKATAKPGSQQI